LNYIILYHFQQFVFNCDSTVTQVYDMAFGSKACHLEYESKVIKKLLVAANFTLRPFNTGGSQEHFFNH